MMVLSSSLKKVYKDLTPEELFTIAVNNKEGVVATNGALTVKTGNRTGRSPRDRFIVRDDITNDKVNWGMINQPISQTIFNKLWDKAVDYMSSVETYASSYRVGAHPSFNIPVTVWTDLAWQNVFAANLFLPMDHAEDHLDEPWTILSAANLKLQGSEDGVKSDAAIILNFSQRKILICGTHYAGEIKKGMFSVLNFLLPDHHILPMHCSANVGNGGDVALFFGLSGTGKTTLSADSERLLIGDDEHGWGSDGIFNFEGGCYAKCINLSQEKEPIIWNAIRHRAIMENVVLDSKGNPVYEDCSLTENTRVAYPLEFVEKRVTASRAGHPQNVIFLTCDLFGVLPPVAKLTKEQAAYYFLSGYTALVGSTEVGSKAGVQPTFSTCFGAPFFSRPAQIYADLLMKKLIETKANVFLVNTGWTGGSYGKGGERFSIPVTRAVVSAILKGDIQKSSFVAYPGFNFMIPETLPGIESNLLDPRKNWSNGDDLKLTINDLAHKFAENMKKFSVSSEILSAGPSPL